jgi:hypothetical protein
MAPGDTGGTHLPYSTSQMRTVLSSLAEAKNEPSAPQLTSFTPRVCPTNWRRHLPFTASHSSSVWSEEVDSKNREQGENLGNCYKSRAWPGKAADV